MLPLKAPGRLLEPRDLEEIAGFFQRHRPSSRSFDIVNIGWTTGIAKKRDSDEVQRFAEAGMTWWLESLYTKRDSPEEMRSRIKSGPPKIIPA